MIGNEICVCLCLLVFASYSVAFRLRRWVENSVLAFNTYKTSLKADNEVGGCEYLICDRINNRISNRDNGCAIPDRLSTITFIATMFFHDEVFFCYFVFFSLLCFHCFCFLLRYLRRFVFASAFWILCSSCFTFGVISSPFYHVYVVTVMLVRCN